MNKIALFLPLLVVFSWGHPVSYTIDLDVSYDLESKKLKVICTSNSKNKCGLYSYEVVDENSSVIKTKRYPFLKSFSSVKVDNKPVKIIFFLRKTPEHNYVKILQ